MRHRGVCFLCGYSRFAQLAVFYPWMRRRRRQNTRPQTEQRSDEVPTSSLLTVGSTPCRSAQCIQLQSAAIGYQIRANTSRRLRESGGGEDGALDNEMQSARRFDPSRCSISRGSGAEVDDCPGSDNSGAAESGVVGVFSRCYEWRFFQCRTLEKKSLVMLRDVTAS